MTATRSSTVCLCIYAPDLSSRLVVDPECVAFHRDEVES